MTYQQCPCKWQYPDSGRCRCGHTDEHHDAGECWANSLHCPDCESNLWGPEIWGGVNVRHCRACGRWEPEQWKAP